MARAEDCCQVGESGRSTIVVSFADWTQYGTITNFAFSIYTEIEFFGFPSERDVVWFRSTWWYKYVIFLARIGGWFFWYPFHCFCSSCHGLQTLAAWVYAGVVVSCILHLASCILHFFGYICMSISCCVINVYTIIAWFSFFIISGEIERSSLFMSTAELLGDLCSCCFLRIVPYFQREHPVIGLLFIRD